MRALTKKEAPQNYEKSHNCATLSLPFPSAPRPSWAGLYSNLPRELKELFEPHIQIHLPRLKRGEILEHGIFVPKIGLLTLRCRNGELFAVFINDLEYAHLKLQLLRREAAAVQHGLVLKNPEGSGIWFSQPSPSILPWSLRVFSSANLPCEQRVEFCWKSPPWRNRADFPDFFEDSKRIVKPSSRWLTPSIPCAVRAPTFALPAGVAGSG